MSEMKENILDAWITVEQLSEGSINTNDKSLMSFKVTKGKIEDVLADYIKNAISNNNIKLKDESKTGVVIFVDVFRSDVIADILKKKYEIVIENEEPLFSNKFSMALYFNKNLEFVEDKFFYTMSGYVKYENNLVKNFHEIENNLRRDLASEVEAESVDVMISKLLNKYGLSLGDCRYKFVRNMENEDAFLHSFFINDLEKAKKVDTENLGRYLKGIKDERQNLDSHKDSPKFNPDLLSSTLKPSQYPSGRFPTNTKYGLSLMQQVAVNLSLNDSNNVRSVNGPPGTGKTTLLKDIFADMVVKQALLISGLDSKKLPVKLMSSDSKQIAILPERIADLGILVASSNNGAVQNIVNELPLINDLDTKFREIDYFKEISNKTAKVQWLKDRDPQSSEEFENINWGTFSLEGGKAENQKKISSALYNIGSYLKADYSPNSEVYEEFVTFYDKFDVKRKDIDKYSRDIKELETLKKNYDKNNKINLKKQDELCRSFSIKKKETTDLLTKLEEENQVNEQKLKAMNKDVLRFKNMETDEENNLKRIKEKKPKFLWFFEIFFWSKVSGYLDQVSKSTEALIGFHEQVQAIQMQIIDREKLVEGLKSEIETKSKEVLDFENKFKRKLNDIKLSLSRDLKRIEILEKDCDAFKTIENLNLSVDYDELQKSTPWFSEEMRVLQSELFVMALDVRKQFLYENCKNIEDAQSIWGAQDQYSDDKNREILIKSAWDWVNFTIPVISTTFASFGRMFRNMQENSIANLFVDEAGQALPQAAVGAIFRAKKIMVVGDPAQIEPVLTLEGKFISLIGRQYDISGKYLSPTASVQTLIDAASQYGYYKGDGEWMGIPLWVHRRSSYPMFTISNEISYNGMMVQGKQDSDAYGESHWIDVTGRATDKFVQEQSDRLQTEINLLLEENSELKEEIYVITPFRNVAMKLAQDLVKINFTQYKDGKPINVGTVHTFQGKEAKIVFLVLGADKSSIGSANWIFKSANLINVAVTRAKERFYVIGDKSLYESLNNQVSSKMIPIIDQYKGRL